MADFKGSHKGIGEMLCAPFMVAEMARLIEKAHVYAKSIAPDAPPYGEGYTASFETEANVRPKRGKQSKRAQGILRNTSPHAMAVEFGTGRRAGPIGPVQRHRTLGRSLDAIKD